MFLGPPYIIQLYVSIRNLILYFDFAKAFNTVHTKELLAKIQSYGIHGNILKWLTSFLTQRRQKVLVIGKSSGWCNVLSGIPQGSVLGPILFIILSTICLIKLPVWFTYSLMTPKSVSDLPTKTKPMTSRMTLTD